MLGALGGYYWPPGFSNLTSQRLASGPTAATELSNAPLLCAALKEERSFAPVADAANPTASSVALPCISELRPAFSLQCMPLSYRNITNTGNYLYGTCLVSPTNTLPSSILCA